MEILLSSENQKSLEIVNNKKKMDSNTNLDELQKNLDTLNDRVARGMDRMGLE